MTETTDILSLPASRELDARVLYVVGWRWNRDTRTGGKVAFLPPVPSDWYAKAWQPHPWGHNLWSPIEAWPDESDRYRDWTTCCIIYDDNRAPRIGMPSPSTSISEAFEVLEKLDINWEAARQAGNYNRFRLWIETGAGRNSVLGKGESLPLAICRAVLRWDSERLGFNTDGTRIGGAK